MESRSEPPFTQVGMASLALIVAGGIYLSAHIPQHVPLAPAIILLVLSAALVAYNLFSLTRVKDFAWWRFFQVAKWAGLAYLFIAAMILYAFLRDSLSGGAAGHPHPLAAGLRPPGADADRLHRGPLRRARRGHRAPQPDRSPPRRLESAVQRP